MSKGLETLKNTMYAMACSRCQYYTDKKCNNKDECFWKTIEKELKALQIIRESPEFPWYVSIYKNAYEMILEQKSFRVENSVEEIADMFNLLKEVLFK